MRASPVLMAAIALNVVLGAALYFRSSGDDSARSARPRQSDPAALFAWAKQQGLSDDVSYRLVLAQLRAEAAPEEPEHYWEPAPERMLARRQREMQRLQEMREQLIGSFGASVTQQPALADVFQPHRSKLPFLSPEKQMALQKILFETSMVETEFAGPRSAGADKRLARIRELLSDEEFAEYQRRESALAMRLANSGFDFTEAEFRAVFDVVSTTGLEPRQSLTPLMPAIGRVLEVNRFREFERSQDPVYRALRSTGQKFAVPQEKIADAYDQILISQKKVAEARSTSKTPSTLMQQLETLIAARDQALMARLGAEVFREIAPVLQSVSAPRSSWAGDPAGAFRPTR